MSQHETDLRPNHETGIDQRDLMALADGRIDAESTHAASVRRYLADHPEDAARVAAWQQQDQAIRSHYAPVLGEAVPDRLQPQRLRAQRARRRHDQLRVAMAASFAAVIVAGVLSVALWQGRAGDTELNRFAEQVATLSSTGALTAEAQVLDGGSHSESLPDLDAVGFSLTDRRTVRTGDRIATEARYEDAQGHALRLFVADEGGTEAPTLHRRAYGSHDIVYWRERGRLYALASDRSLQPGRLEQIASATMKGSTGPRSSAGTALAEMPGAMQAEPGNTPIVTMDGGRQRAMEPAPGSRANVHYEGMVKDSSL